MTYQFYISLNGVKPKVWRRVLVPDYMTFDEFHMVLQVAMGWEDIHLYQFATSQVVGKEYIGILEEEELEDFVHRRKPKLNALKLNLRDYPLEVGQLFEYRYDFGDDWRHTVKLEKVIENHLLYPRCLAGKGICPPEDCGGTQGYVHLLESMADPLHGQHQEFRKWLGLKKGERFEELYGFDLKAANAIMLEIFIEENKA